MKARNKDYLLVPILEINISKYLLLHCDDAMTDPGCNADSYGKPDLYNNI